MRLTNNNIDKIKNDIAVEHRRLEAANGGGNRERLAELEKAKSEATNAQERLETHKGDLQVLLDKRNEAEQSYKVSKVPLEQKRQEVSDCESRLDQLKRDRGQQRNGFPPSMNALLNAIRHDKGFQQTPIGPIGHSIQLLKPAWSSVLEKTFGGILNSFLVTSKQDQGRLSGIMQRIKRFADPFSGGGQTY